MKRGIVLTLLLGILLSYAMVAQSQENNEIEQIFGDDEEAEVIVILKDDASSMKTRSASSDRFEARKSMIKKQQRLVLEDLDLKDDEDTVISKKAREPVFPIDNAEPIQELPESELIPTDQNESTSKELQTELNIEPESEESIQTESKEPEYDFEIRHEFDSINYISGILTKQGYEKLKNNPRVAAIVKNGRKNIALSQSVPLVNATNTWQLIYNGTNITGRGQSVCVIDTGIDYTHPSLGGCTSQQFADRTCSKVLGGHDYVNGDTDPIDDQGHGTHVAGIIASENVTHRGIAPGATLIAVKVCDSSSGGACNDDDIIAGINWCVSNASRFNISVISMSLGGSLYSNYCDSEALEIAFASPIDTATAQNISVVVAAGNSPTSTQISSPACIRNSIAVSSVSKSDIITAGFSRNSLTDLLAPGESITSTVPRGGCVNCAASGLATFSGTSMSTPHVSGAIALLRQYKKLEKNITLSPDNVTKTLNLTGTRLTDSGGSGLTFSRINIYPAILSMDSTAPNISFVAPTPSNNTNLTFNSTNGFLYINITSSETISSPVIEISNGTTMNISMNTNGPNPYINLTYLKKGVRALKLYISDAAGNTATRDLLIQVNNTAPNFTGFFPENYNTSTTEPNNLTFYFNTSDLENDSIFYFWYLNNSVHTQGIGKSEFNFSGNFTSSGVYIVNATAFDGSQLVYQTWNFSVNNTNLIPTATSVNLTNTDYLNRTNGTLQAYWSSSDFDNDAIIFNETLWYNGTVLFANLTNRSLMHPLNTTKNQNWTFSVRVFDGINWSSFVNSTSTIIANANPAINITTSYTISETQAANITLNATDIDDDFVNYTINNSNFARINNSFVWITSLSSAGTYTLNVTANDSASIDSSIVTLTVEDARDLDNDGNPDFTDSDDDNDGISDTDDFTLGNISNINSTISLNLTINGTSNTSKLYNGTFAINISNGTSTFIEFNFTFNSSNIFDFGNITINRTFSGRSAVSIKGNLNLFNTTKTVYLDKVNSTARAVCIKDASVDFESISSSCNGANEVLLSCANATSGQYTCLDDGLRYIVSGLNHSAVKEQCRDNDGDGFGVGCTAGTDGCDTDSSTSGSCPSGGGGGGSGGGGGGGGGGAFFICNEEWQCSSYSPCLDGISQRTCSLVRVPQHSQSKECDSIENKPNLSASCEVPKPKLPDANCTDGIKNQDEIGMDCGGKCKPCTKITENQTNNITGAATGNVSDRRLSSYILVGISIAALGSIVLLYSRHHKANKR